MPRYWMITDRDVGKRGLGRSRADLSYWVADEGPLGKLATWTKVTERAFRVELLRTAARFPPLLEREANECQQHVGFFVHGYNNDWADAAVRYGRIRDSIFAPEAKLGVCVLFSWPSDGMKVAYLPDREDARICAGDLAYVFSEIYDWLLIRQAEAAVDPKKSCRAKLSVIAHSMGNYLLQRAMQTVWTRKNQPLLVSLLNQLVMVAADVDNDLFKGGETVDKSDGDAIANLSYRVTALYSGRDSVLGMSAGLKHFGKRRLGRSGLDRTCPCPDNVWDFDCSRYFAAGQENIHSAYFDVPETTALMQDILRGFDRTLIGRSAANQ